MYSAGRRKYCVCCVRPIKFATHVGYFKFLASLRRLMAYRNARKTLEAYLLRGRKTLRREARLITVGLSTCSTADELTDRPNVQSGHDKCAARYWCVTIGRSDCFWLRAHRPRKALWKQRKTNIRGTEKYCVGRDNVVGTMNRYGMDDPGVESRWRRNVSHPSRQALGRT